MEPIRFLMLVISYLGLAYTSVLRNLLVMECCMAMLQKLKNYLEKDFFQGFEVFDVLGGG